MMTAHSRDAIVGEDAKRRLYTLFAELYELEQESYRTSLLLLRALRVKRGNQSDGDHEPATGDSPALRAVVAHVNESIDELRALGKIRHVRLGSITALIGDAFVRLLDAVGSDQPDAVEEARTALDRGVALARLIRVEALACGDGTLAQWSHRWLQARVALLREASPDLVGRAPAGAHPHRFAIPAR